MYLGEFFNPKLIKLSLKSGDYIPRARHAARDVAEAIGLGTTDTTRIVMAVSKLARNVFLYVGERTMSWGRILKKKRNGLTFVFEDDVPGTATPDIALRGEYSTSNEMGRGVLGT